MARPKKRNTEILNQHFDGDKQSYDKGDDGILRSRIELIAGDVSCLLNSLENNPAISEVTQKIRADGFEFLDPLELLVLYAWIEKKHGKQVIERRNLRTKPHKQRRSERRLGTGIREAKKAARISFAARCILEGIPCAIAFAKAIELFPSEKHTHVGFEKDFKDFLARRPDIMKWMDKEIQKL